MIDTIVAVLQADATLTSLLTGGIYDYKDVKEISREFTPDAYDEYLELKPTALVREESTVPGGPLRDSATIWIAIFFYQRAGYDIIQQARHRTYQLLHRSQPISLDPNHSFFEIRHANDLSGQEDIALNASLEQSRYEGIIQRTR